MTTGADPGSPSQLEAGSPGYLILEVALVAPGVNAATWDDGLHPTWDDALAETCKANGHMWARHVEEHGLDAEAARWATFLPFRLVSVADGGPRTAPDDGSGP